MEKLYTKQDYINACKQANAEGKIDFKYIKSIRTLENF